MDLYIDGHNINSIPEIQYIMVVVEWNIWQTQIKLKIDIGQGFSNESKITDSGNKISNFKSEIDILNYLYKCNWEYLDSTIQNTSSGLPSKKMIFKRIFTLFK